MIPRRFFGAVAARSEGLRRESHADRNHDPEHDPDGQRSPGLNVDRAQGFRTVGVVTVRLTVIIRAVRLVGDITRAVRVSAPVVLASDRWHAAHTPWSPPTAFSHVDFTSMPDSPVISAARGVAAGDR
jgi:hypothetical protein